ncbi:ABC transporter ATP-binding protein [Emcibacter sp. SYSU 3D8]|uniref:ABC transporter ATP-binding protein n=1 Tax=Emcibacter sp. SYSU 3D8 TaxID=3133969 RepID=UPI0031FE7DDA
MTEVLRAEHVTRELTGEVPVTLVRDASLVINRGEFVSIMGPSGSGKSSLLYLLGLLDMPTSGTITLDGQAVTTLTEREIARVRLEKLGFVFQFHFLLVEFSVLDNVTLPMAKLGRLTDREQRERAESLLTDLGMGDQIRKRPDQLSGGQRQRVAIARALANDPLIILADEPTGNLDSKSSANVRDILSELVHQRDKTVVAVTHDPDFARAGDRQIHIIDGRIATEDVRAD